MAAQLACQQALQRAEQESHQVRQEAEEALLQADAVFDTLTRRAVAYKRQRRMAAQGCSCLKLAASSGAGLNWDPVTGLHRQTPDCTANVFYMYCHFIATCCVQRADC